MRFDGAENGVVQVKLEMGMKQGGWFLLAGSKVYGFRGIDVGKGRTGGYGVACKYRQDPTES